VGWGGVGPTPPGKSQLWKLEARFGNCLARFGNWVARFGNWIARFGNWNLTQDLETSEARFGNWRFGLFYGFYVCVCARFPNPGGQFPNPGGPVSKSWRPVSKSSSPVCKSWSPVSKSWRSSFQILEASSFQSWPHPPSPSPSHETCFVLNSLHAI